jgi:hypothetical protein
MIVEIRAVLRKKGHGILKRDEVHETRGNKDCNLLISPLNLSPGLKFNGLSRFSNKSL